MAKKTNLKEHTPEELLVLVGKKREELRGLRFSAEGSKNRNVKAAREMRKEVARAMTELTARKQK